jgi:hypothetical protein
MMHKPMADRQARHPGYEMRAGDPIASSISAIQTVLHNINPSYEWVPVLSTTGGAFLVTGSEKLQGC